MNPIGETSRIDYQGLQVGGQLCLSLPLESSGIGYLSHGDLSKKGFHREQTFQLGDYGLMHSRDKSAPPPGGLAFSQKRPSHRWSTATLSA